MPFQTVRCKNSIQLIYLRLSIMIQNSKKINAQDIDVTYLLLTDLRLTSGLAVSISSLTSTLVRYCVGQKFVFHKNQPYRNSDCQKSVKNKQGFGFGKFRENLPKILTKILMKIRSKTTVQNNRKFWNMSKMIKIFEIVPNWLKITTSK